ncbi:putative F-box protein At4g38870 [Solanum stenotomum]|uniref:putative F-box protein At4g38870 n=1 Tax=Solanum stenotomum TaxID=172797 RepID=UPI0020D0CCA2|nr:putative F-box protein At4g38870 [Solanum stenotomum]
MDTKMKKFGKRKVSIPDEIMFEIFSWLPVKSLMRFKCVSKLCNSLVFESGFVDMHRCHSMTRPGTKLFLHERKAFYWVEQEKGRNMSASLFQFTEPTNKSRMNCANGLFCVWQPSTVRSAVIFNPGTREVRSLPRPNKGTSCGNYLIGFEPQENKYKVFLSEKLSGYRQQWVLTLGIDESWRQTQSIFPSILYGKPGVCISGVIYQLFESAHKSAIAAVDVKSENFEIITLWNEFTWLCYYHLIEVKGKLAVVDCHMVKNSIDLWILEHSLKGKWKRHVIQFPSKWNYKVPGPISFCMSRDGKIVLIRNFNSSALCWCYDLNATRRRWRKIEIKGLPEETRIYGIYSYVETLDMLRVS